MSQLGVERGFGAGGMEILQQEGVWDHRDAKGAGLFREQAKNNKVFVQSGVRNNPEKGS